MFVYRKKEEISYYCRAYNIEDNFLNIHFTTILN